jgi:hypothetical protein
MSSPRQDFTATLLPDGRVLAAGGASSGGLAYTDIYDPSTNSWSAGPAMTVPREGATATLLVDGDTGNGTKVVMTVDPMHGETWTQRILAGRKNELDNLQAAIARRT